MDVLTYMNSTGASPLEVAAVFDIPSQPTFANWKEALGQMRIADLISKKKRASIYERES